MTWVGFVMTNNDWFWVGLALGAAALWGLSRVVARRESNDTAAATEHSYAHIHKKNQTYWVYTPFGLFFVKKKKKKYDDDWHAGTPGKWFLTTPNEIRSGYDTRKEWCEAIQRWLRDAERERSVLKEANWQCQIKCPSCTNFATTVDYPFPPAEYGPSAWQFGRAACPECGPADAAKA